MLPNRSTVKILHILDHSLPLHSGYAFRSQSIFRSQLKRGWGPVAVVSPKHEESWEGPCSSEEEIGGVRYYRTGRLERTGIPIADEFRLMARLTRRIRQVVEIEKPHVLHAHSPVLNVLPALRVGKRLGLPVVYEIRAFWEDAAVDHGTYGPHSWKYKLGRALETRSCRRASHVTVLCQGLREDLRARGIPPEKISVVYNGIDAEDFLPCEPDAEFRIRWNLVGKEVIGFVGSFYRYEGLDLLIRAAARLSETHPHLVLLLVGGGEVEVELRAQIAELRLTDKAILAGRIPHGRVPGVYALMDVLVYPRYSMRLTELVTPLKPLEAMAMGKVVVASDIGGHRELIRHGQTGLLFPAGDARALAETIERVLEDSEFRQRLEAQERTWVRQEHSWDKTTAVYSDIYARVVKRSAV